MSDVPGPATAAAAQSARRNTSEHGGSAVSLRVCVQPANAATDPSKQTATRPITRNDARSLDRTENVEVIIVVVLIEDSSIGCPPECPHLRLPRPSSDLHRSGLDEGLGTLGSVTAGAASFDLIGRAACVPQHPLRFIRFEGVFA